VCACLVVASVAMSDGETLGADFCGSHQLPAESVINRSNYSSSPPTRGLAPARIEIDKDGKYRSGCGALRLEQLRDPAKPARLPLEKKKKNPVPNFDPRARS